jgi:hypothetical protein
MVEYYEKSWRWNPSASFLYEVKIRRHDVHILFNGRSDKE